MKVHRIARMPCQSSLLRLTELDDSESHRLQPKYNSKEPRRKTSVLPTLQLNRITICNNNTEIFHKRSISLSVSHNEMLAMKPQIQPKTRFLNSDQLMEDLKRRVKVKLLLKNANRIQKVSKHTLLK